MVVCADRERDPTGTSTVAGRGDAKSVGLWGVDRGRVKQNYKIPKIPNHELLGSERTRRSGTEVSVQPHISKSSRNLEP